MHGFMRTAAADSLQLEGLRSLLAPVHVCTLLQIDICRGIQYLQVGWKIELLSVGPSNIVRKGFFHAP